MSAFRVHVIRTALYSLAGSLVWTGMMVYQIEVAGLTPLQLVLVGTMMELSILFFEVPTGIVADVYSRRRSVIIGCFIMGAAYIVQGLFPLFVTIMLGQFIWGLGFTFISGAYDAWLVDEIGQERAGEAFLRGSQVSSIAAIVGILLAILLGNISLQISIIVGGSLVMGIGVFLWFSMAETNFTPTARGDRNPLQNMRDTFVDGLRVVRGRPGLISILLIGLFYGLYSEAWDRLWQIHLIEGIGLPAIAGMTSVTWIGLLNLTTMLVGVGAAEIARRRLNMNHAPSLRRALFVMTALMVGSLIAYGLAGSFVMAIAAFFLFTTMRGLTGPIYDTWSNQHIESRVRATVLSMRSQTDAIGQIAGGPPLGLVGQLSLPAAFLGSALLLSPILWLLRRIGRVSTPAPVVEPAEV